MFVEVFASKVLKLNLEVKILQKGKTNSLALVQNVEVLVPAVGTGYHNEKPDWVPLFHANAREVEIPSWLEKIRRGTLVLLYEGEKNFVKTFNIKNKITIRKGEEYPLSDLVIQKILELFLENREPKWLSIGFGGLYINWAAAGPEERELLNELFPLSLPEKRKETLEDLIKSQAADMADWAARIKEKEKEIDDWGYPVVQDQEEEEGPLWGLFEGGGWHITDQP